MSFKLHTRTLPPCSVNILESHANNVDEQMTERQRFGARADFVSLFSSNKETSAVSLSLRFEVKNVSVVKSNFLFFTKNLFHGSQLNPKHSEKVMFTTL